jgi:hypothetical protein
VEAAVKAPAAIASQMTEAKLQETVRQLCKNLGLFHYHPFDSRRSEPGWPDSVVIGYGGIIFRELKSERGVVSTDQRQVGHMIRAAGGSWGVWRPSDLFAGTIAAELAELATRGAR